MHELWYRILRQHMSYRRRRGHKERGHICRQLEEPKDVDFGSCLKEREQICPVQAGQWQVASLSVPCAYEDFLIFRHYIVKKFMLCPMLNDFFLPMRNYELSVMFKPVPPVNLV